MTFTKVSTTIMIKMNHNQVSVGLLYSTFPLTTLMFCHLSPNLMAVPKLFLQHLKKRTKHLGKIVFEIAKFKVQHWWPLTQTVWDVLSNYIKQKEILWTTSGVSCMASELEPDEKLIFRRILAYLLLLNQS